MKVEGVIKADAGIEDTKNGSLFRMGDAEGLLDFSDLGRENGNLGQSLEQHRPRPPAHCRAPNKHMYRL